MAERPGISSDEFYQQYPDLHALFTATFGRVQALYAQYRDGQMRRPAALAAIGTEFRTLITSVEPRSAELARQAMAELGYDTLSTDTYGHRSKDWFAGREKQGFATGVASTCLVSMVGHDGIGVGASHVNTLTPSSLTQFLDTHLDELADPDFYQRIATMDDRAQLMFFSGGLASIKKEAAVGINLALQQFAVVAKKGGIPRDGTVVACGGIDYLSPQDVESSSISSILSDGIPP